ncbi:MAG: N-acetylmuramoyl-L-alanine amidase [Tannerellaceae bacterium]|nr:N-acetylmuramoyl-L-alanine amidase [Tannerellaceae bacterium]
MRKINKIIIHCTATPEGRTVTVEDVDTWHRQRGFNGIGYHYLIGLNGELWTGRNIEAVGAHCVGQNTNSIGVCYVGGLAKDGKTSKDTRTEKQKKTLQELVCELKMKYPAATLHGHKEFAAKDCPCFDVKKEFI